jgi:hypothetical protein
MKESLRRVILFAVIVITGSIMILFDVPLIIMIPLILAVGFIILLILGAIKLSDVNAIFRKRKEKNVKKISLIQRLNDMKFFEKKPVQASTTQVPAATKKVEPKDKVKSIAKKPGAVSHLRSFFTSLGSLRSVLKERSKQQKKVEHIDALLDKAVREKVKSSPLATAGKSVDTKIPPTGITSRPGTNEQEKEQDPFLSLSGDEFDVSLLDGLDEQETPESPSLGQITEDAIIPESSLTINEPEIPLPSLEINTEADTILKENEGGLEEFSGLEGGESIDQDFSDLDNINLDEIDLDVDLEQEKTPVAAGSEPPAEGSQKTMVKADWIASDAPKGADLPGNDISTHQDMASFASGASGSDADMLSSLASDVKFVAKEKNISLLRDLSDFKAPASEIESELQELRDRMKAGQGSGKKISPQPKRQKQT